MRSGGAALYVFARKAVLKTIRALTDMRKTPHMSRNDVLLWGAMIGWIVGLALTDDLSGCAIAGNLEQESSLYDADARQ